MSKNTKPSPKLKPAGGPQLPVPVFTVKLVRERDHMTEQVHTPADAARIACELLDGYDREAFLVLALSSSARIIGAHVAHVGTLDASIVSPREVFRFALLTNAARSLRPTTTPAAIWKSAERTWLSRAHSDRPATSSA